MAKKNELNQLVYDELDIFGSDKILGMHSHDKKLASVWLKTEMKQWSCSRTAQSVYCLLFTHSVTALLPFEQALIAETRFFRLFVLKTDLKLLISGEQKAGVSLRKTLILSQVK